MTDINTQIAVMMKARQYDRRFFSRSIQPHVYAIVESNHVDKFAVGYFCNGDMKLTAAMDTIIKELHDAKEYGSILTVTSQDWSALYDRFAEIMEDINMSRETALRELLPLVQVAEGLAQKYDVVVTNPPYRALTDCSIKLNNYVKKGYSDSKSDLFAVFIERCGLMVKNNCYQAMITQHAWMFLSSFEKLRAKLQRTDTINMAHLGSRAFEEIGGEVVQTTSFVMRKSHIASYKGSYYRLIEPTSQQGNQPQYNCGRKYPDSDEAKKFFELFNALSLDPITKEEIEKEANSIPEYMALPLCKEAMNLIKVQTTPKSEEELMKQFRMVSRIALREGIYPSAFYLILIDNFSKLS